MDDILRKCIEDLKRYKLKVFDKVGRKSVDDYSFLQEEFCKGDISNNLVFQKTYRRFYQLDRAGLTPQWKERYFNLLESKRGSSSEILSEILWVLSEIPTLQGHLSVQFSFATKLLHTINPELPIYDSMVGKIFGIQPAKSYGKIKDRIESRVVDYENLKVIYQKLLTRSDVRQIIQEFKAKFNAEHLSQVKALDFLLWGLGKVLLEEFNSKT